MRKVNYNQVQIEPLTTEEVAAIKSADVLVFHYRNGQSFIRTLKEKEMSSSEETGKIGCATQVDKYGKLGDVRSASHVMNFIQDNDHMLTILHNLSKGKKIKLVWICNNNNNLLRDAGLYNDELHLQIIDDKGNMKSFIVDKVVSANNTAKMIKNESTPMSVVGE